MKRAQETYPLEEWLERERTRRRRATKCYVIYSIQVHCSSSNNHPPVTML